MNFFSLYKRKLLYKIRKKTDIDLDDSFNEKSLEDIFAYYGTDKANFWREKNSKGHGYSKYYEKHFKQIRNQKVNILEIGSYSGASAASFSKYFPNSKIFCLDINISNFKFSSNKIHVFGTDVSSSKMISNFYKEINISSEENFFDIIIDDGSHKLSDILFSLNSFYKNLKKNGFYVIEDFMFPNYFEHLNDVDELKIDELAERIRNKKKFNSNIIEDKLKNYFKNKNNIVNVYKGNLSNSDIVFFQKN